MPTVSHREVYFEAGLEILAEAGFGGLKLAELCGRLGVTTGSFYHYFANWSAYTKELVDHWFKGLTVGRVQQLRAEPDPRRRIDATIQVGLSLPHGADAAIRAWSSMDPTVAAAQREIDLQRYQLLRDSAVELLGNARQAQLFANWAVYLLVGYEQAMLPPDTDGLEWIVGQLLEALDSGRFATVPDDAST
ncbi:TetR/AcrR family transcriptional regulator [Mycolicibacterium palauense]|uniref:TetR/AcrR family transcriptional regulator n=1 Tax=Mycolicibacterium palauense TaxID=2034511 RepID=UPI000BFF19F1|nr:TetR/AcrR family transcriptional regulator [Mycolicibacterium palauense]